MKIVSTIFNNLKNKFTKAIKATISRFGWLIASSSLMTLYFTDMLSSVKVLPILSITITALTIFLIISILHMIFGHNFFQLKAQYKKEELGLTRQLFFISSMIMVLLLWCKIDFSYILPLFEPYLEYILFINSMCYIRSGYILCISRPSVCHGLITHEEHKKLANKVKKEEKELELTYYFEK